MQIMNLNRTVGGLNNSDENHELLFVEKILSQSNKAKKIFSRLDCHERIIKSLR